ncbi:MULTISPECIES: YicC/YloC family endoribonuclease [unclassified Bacillus (in: firmicutes)]|uniref:YicC/YloC family endoribonuclease n=1 Tax=unclassified Bacillus (in: firmicutes) TaxID=185979 RepID=UPI001BEB5F7B|nr:MULTISPECIES: YicC/YloC family endoribonuclease [unclassified Bacillus (in: firmicutes)]MBT2637195.1 YicC family protein [Bacillus sp. ISL-39]MBT2660268.1 YicC family protein [Bacillus sp. ISL-45]
MVVSMTGFGRSRTESDRFSVTVEVKTVNHRFCEFHIRMPRQLLKTEEKIKKKLGAHIKRGRVEVFVTLEGEGIVSRSVHIDWEALDELVHHITEIKNRYSIAGDIELRDIVSRQEIIHIEEIEAENEELELLLLSAVEDAGGQLVQMRMLEGSALEKDVLQHIQQLKENITSVKKLAPSVVEQYRERLQKKMAELTDSQAGEDRILTEVAFFADKADISEEIARLESHVSQFKEILKANEPLGRKLDFLLQEMNREVNTIGSKANDSRVAREVVEMKSLLEKVKEQVQNIE